MEKKCPVLRWFLEYSLFHAIKSIYRHMKMVRAEAWGVGDLSLYEHQWKKILESILEGNFSNKNKEN